MKTTLLRVTMPLALAAIFALSCQQMEEPSVQQPAQEEETVTVLDLSLAQPLAKTTMGESADGKRKVYWSNGDCVSLNGTSSQPLADIPAQSVKAVFTFPGTPATPYKLLYPASFYKDAGTVTLPASQEFAEGSFATGTEPLCGYAASAGDDISLNHLCSIILLKIKASEEGVTLKKVTFQGNAGEQVSGDFAIDYPAHTLTATSDADSDKQVSMSLSQSLSVDTALEVYLVVPAATYARGFCLVMEDSDHQTMTMTKRSSATLAAGILVKMPEFSFVPGKMDFELPEMEEEVIEPDGYNVKGRVVDTSGNGIADVVVTDGTQCVRTMVNGQFFMTSTMANVKFVHVSTPSGYMPQVEGGIPKFYKAKAAITPVGGVYDFGDYVLTPVDNPNRFTLLISADPQPRASDINLDNVAYRSLRGCECLYLDLKETASPVLSDHQVVGLCVGDLVHEDMDLMDTYATALGTLGYPTYNVIGNHDNDPAAADDDGGAWKFESLFGPRNYSFNLGGMHFVVLDNLIMKDNGYGSLTAYDQGLSDSVWAWLQADMAFVPYDTKIMVFAHSPMFKQSSGSERTNTAKHGGHTNTSEGGAFGYGDLFDQYAEVHAWAGHTHQTFNYIYRPTHRHKNIQVHTLARSTGELWTNEYLSNGTPRGFTIVEMENGDISSWRFHPTKYLKSNFHGTHGQPEYTYCDWTYNGSNPSVAKMKDTGKDLDESYQMHVFSPSDYGDNKIYANIFLWDSLWETPTLSVDGGAPVEMELVEDVDTSPENRVGYDRADKELVSFYYANYSLLRAAGYDSFAPGMPLTIFRAKTTAPASGTGTVSVTDRFGNTYTRTISW